MLGEANALSFCGTPPVADPNEVPMNRWTHTFEHAKANSYARASAIEGVRTIQ
jgi:hypothetical protein